VEAASAWPCASPGDMAAGKRGLKRGLATRKRTVILMLDETIITETPPLYACYGHIGEQVCVPITGNHARRILHGVLNVQNGEVLLLITEEWVQETHQAFLIMIRSHWRGWNIVLFEDRGSPHTAGESLRLAGELHIKLRFLPKATPELNAMDHLWRHVKGRGLANRATQSIDESADSACRYILDMSRRERLRKAGVLSGNFWLTKGLFCQRTF
jgi:transposase